MIIRRDEGVHRRDFSKNGAGWSGCVVTTAIGNTGTASAKVLAAAQSLSRESNQLMRAVETFLKSVHTA